MKARPIEVIQEQGRLLARIPLGQHNKHTPLRYAEMWKEDYDFLVRLGLSPNWSSYRTKSTRYYVSSAAKGNASTRILVARVLLDAVAGQAVKYLDGNSLNLRRENLRLCTNARGKARARNFVFGKNVEVHS